MHAKKNVNKKFKSNIYETKKTKIQIKAVYRNTYVIK